MEFDLVGNGVKLTLKENVLAVISDVALNSVSSAIYNGGGLKKTQIIINTQVTDEYGDRNLHDDPHAFILKSFKKLGLNNSFVGMVTYANIADFALVSKRDEDIAVSVVATAGCTHAESSGEKISIEPIEGTINIIVIIDGHPNEACLVSSLITATEAKTAALRDLDVRSRYSGSEATGTLTDAMVVAETGIGTEIFYGGPASKLGQLVGICTRQAVKEAVIRSKIGGFVPSRSVVLRLEERHLSIKKLALELLKIKSLNADYETLNALLTRKLDKDPLFSCFLFAAVKLSDDFEKGLVPQNFTDVGILGKNFGDLFSNNVPVGCKMDDYQDVDLPSFLIPVLVNLLKDSLSLE